MIKSSVKKCNFHIDGNKVKCILVGNYTDNGVIIAPFREIGVSTCSKEDTFDELKGKHIAESKAKEKVYRHMLTHLIDEFETNDELITYLSDLSKNIDKYQHLVDREVSHIKDLMA